MTTTYSVQGPDGQAHQFSGPDGATPDQVMQIAHQQFGSPSGAQEPPPQPPTSGELAFTAGQERGESENPVQAGVGQAAQQGTFGLQNYINAGARYAAQRIMLGKGDTFADDLAFSRGMSQGEASGHPITATIGGTAGAFLGGGGLAKAAPGALTRFLAPKAGAAIANVGKAMTAGAVVGGGQSLAEGQPLPQAAQTAAISAVTAPVAGKVMSFALNSLQPTARKAMMTLADTLNETPGQLQAAYDTFIKLTGRAPSMAEVTNLKSQGALRKLASANATIGDAATKAANAGGAPLHEQLNAAQNAAYPQTVNGINELRDAETDAAMNTPHPQTGIKLKDAAVPDPTGVLLDPHVEYALRPNAAVSARLNQASPALVRAQTNSATIADVDQIRKALRDAQNSFMRPAPGSMNARDPGMAKEFGDIANKVEGLGTRADPDYGLVLDNYRQHSRYAEGFDQGFSGKSVGDINPDDSLRAAAMKTQSGMKGYEHGNALSTAQQALNIIRPGSVAPQSTGIDTGHLAQGAMAASSHGIGAYYHAVRAIPGLHLPEATQKVIANQLFNPKTAQQGINNLRRAGIDSDGLRQIVGMTGLAAAGNTGRYLSNNE